MTRKHVSDESTLSVNPPTRLNFEFTIADGRMTWYMIQLEYNEGDWLNPDWKQVARFDSSHGFFHMDVHHASGGKEKFVNRFPQSLTNTEEYEVAKGYLISNEYELLTRSGHV